LGDDKSKPSTVSDKAPVWNRPRRVLPLETWWYDRPILIKAAYVVAGLFVGIVVLVGGIAYGWFLFALGIFLLSLVAWIPWLGRRLLAWVGWTSIPRLGSLLGLRAAGALIGMSISTAIVGSAVAPLRTVSPTASPTFAPAALAQPSRAAVAASTTPTAVVEATAPISQTPSPSPVPAQSPTPRPTVAPTLAPWQRIAGATPDGGGNNREASSWAKALCCFGSGFDYKLWMDLTPVAGGDVTGNSLIQYRTSVTQAVGYIVLPSAALVEWNRNSAAIKSSFLGSLLDATHQAPAIVTGPLDYYPNAGLVRYTMYKDDGTVLATAEWNEGQANIIKLSQ